MLDITFYINNALILICFPRSIVLHDWVSKQPSEFETSMIYDRATESYTTYSNTSVEYQFEVSQILNFSFCVCHLPAQTEHCHNNSFLCLLYEIKKRSICFQNSEEIISHLIF